MCTYLSAYSSAGVFICRHTDFSAYTFAVIRICQRIHLPSCRFVSVFICRHTDLSAYSSALKAICRRIHLPLCGFVSVFIWRHSILSAYSSAFVRICWCIHMLSFGFVGVFICLYADLLAYSYAVMRIYQRIHLHASCGFVGGFISYATIRICLRSNLICHLLDLSAYSSSTDLSACLLLWTVSRSWCTRGSGPGWGDRNRTGSTCSWPSPISTTSSYAPSTHLTPQNHRECSCVLYPLYSMYCTVQKIGIKRLIFCTICNYFSFVDSNSYTYCRIW